MCNVYSYIRTITYFWSCILFHMAALLCHLSCLISNHIMLLNMVNISDPLSIWKFLFEYLKMINHHEIISQVAKINVIHTIPVNWIKLVYKIRVITCNVNYYLYRGWVMGLISIKLSNDANVSIFLYCLELSI